MQSSRFPKLELKYCERCGGLWFRPQGGQEVYCARCINAIQELPAVKPKAPGRPDAESTAAKMGGLCA